MKILIVDDSRAMRSIIRQCIEHFDYKAIEILMTDSGANALDIITSHQPQLILCDWHMPTMSGMEMLHRLNAKQINIPFGFVTTEMSADRKMEALIEGAKFFIQKPFAYSVLQEAVAPIIYSYFESQGISYEKKLINEEGNNKDNNQYENSEDNVRDEPQDSSHISLPDRQTLHHIIADFAQIKVKVSTTSGMQTLQRKACPHLIGLFEDARHNVKAAAIINQRASCILGAAITGMTSEDIDKMIEHKTIPKPIFSACETIMSALSNILYDPQQLQTLVLRSVNILNKPAEGIERLLKAKDGERVDVEISAKHYGSGNITLVAS